MSTPLDPTGNAVPVGRSTLRTPGLTGTARALDTTNPAVLRSEELTTDALEEALAHHGCLPQETIEIDGARELDMPGVRTRSTSTNEPALVMETPHPGDEFAQVVLAQDESGVVTWNFPRTDDDAIDVTRGGGTLTYVIRRYVPPPASQADAQTRGLLGAVGKKVLKVLAFPVVDKAIGRIAEPFAEHWEERHRPYRLRTFSPADARDADGSPPPDSFWRQDGDARGLLFIHGTFSRAHSAFGGLDTATLSALSDHYGQRVAAFDHFTLSHDPRRNVKELVAAVPEDSTLNIDIICHSRGGLVSRVLCEQQGPISLGSRTIRIGTVVFVAAPNAGTALADGKHIGALIDRYTTILNLFPDNGVTEVLEAIITVVKHLAVGVLGGLPGLKSMVPGGPFLAGLKALETASVPRYCALAADYEPANGGLMSLVRDGLADLVFGKAGNDLVVPTARRVGRARRLGLPDRRAQGLPRRRRHPALRVLPGCRRTP